MPATRARKGTCLGATPSCVRPAAVPTSTPMPRHSSFLMGCGRRHGLKCSPRQTPKRHHTSAQPFTVDAWGSPDVWVPGCPPWVHLGSRAPSTCSSTTQGGLVTSAPTSCVPKDTHVPASCALLAKSAWGHMLGRGKRDSVVPRCCTRSRAHSVPDVASRQSLGSGLSASDRHPVENRGSRWSAKPCGASGLVSFSQSHPRAEQQ